MKLFRWRNLLLRAVPVAGLLAIGFCRALAAGFVDTNVGTVFMIGFENHNFTQPNPFGTSPEQISNNPACPYLNSLITPGNSNAVHVSFCAKYYNTGTGCHPSEPNYIWQEAGSNLGILADSDPSSGAGNVFSVMHFTKQLDAAGISWKNYEEDVEYTTPVVSKSGTRPSGVNPYNGSTQYYYACKHNPMCFFTDSQTKNVFSLTNFLPDLTNNNVGKYNWIMPNIQNCMHTATTASFTYHGTVYSGGSDQCAIAEGDNFLSILIPKIMASTAFQKNGIIIIRFDESEGGDTTSWTIPEIIISPLAKGNAYASGVVASHSSDLRTMEEIFGLNFTNPAGPYYLSNAIPSGETAATPASTYNNIATVNDLADLFQAAPVITSQPVSRTNIAGTSASFTVGATAYATPACQWYFGTNALAGQTNSTLTLASVTPANAGSYSVVVSNVAGSISSAPALLTVIYQTPSLLGGQIVTPGGGFQLTFSGPAGQPYEVLASVSPTAPLSAWSVVATGYFGSGNASFTDSPATNQAARFFVIKSP